MSLSSPSSGPLVLQSRSHYLNRSSFQSSHRGDVLKDVNQLLDIDLDVWTALNIQGIVLDLSLLNKLSVSEQQDWVRTVQAIGITIFGLDRTSHTLEEELPSMDWEFPVVRLNGQLLLTRLKDCTACLSPQPDRLVFLGHSWGDRIASWILGCRFMAVS